ncbi:MAG: Mov34/MPN/PAD-1 family protein [Dehalococcoidia bacterium]
MIFIIEQRYIDEMIAHAREELPNECCGMLLGREGQVLDFRPCTNAAPPADRPFRYEVSPKELLAIFNESRERDWDVLVIYHSHTHTPAYPSPTDVRLAGYPEVVYILVSLQDPEHPAVHAFSIDQEKRTGDHRDAITELQIEIASQQP